MILVRFGETVFAMGRRFSFYPWRVTALVIFVVCVFILLYPNWSRIETAIETARIVDWKEDMKNLRTFGAVESIPSLAVLNSYNDSKLSAIFHSYLDNVDILCHRKLRMGNIGDGGWEICDDYTWRPIQPCVIYSFGINFDFSFDDDAGNAYGCDVFSFDPSMHGMSTSRRSDRVMYYKLGIGGQPGQALVNDWILHSMSSLKAMLNHTKTTIDVIKMDVEQAEWSALPNMLKEGQLNNVRQLLVEYHQFDDNATTLRSRLQVLGDIERGGFKRFYVHKNPVCHREAVGVPMLRTSCYEVHYVNGKFKRENPPPNSNE